MTDVTAVVVTLRDSPRLRAAIASVHDAAVSRRVEVVCVVNDPGAVGTWMEDGVRFVGAGMNLGWAAGMHAGLIDASGTHVWAIQDDLVVAPGSLDVLCDLLESDDGLAAVRPLNVGSDGMVTRGGLGGLIHADGRWGSSLLDRATPAADLASPPTGDFLLSSGQLVRRDVWDAVGGFDPWYYPWGYVDIDFGRTLREAGWRFANVGSALMTHAPGGSTTSMFRNLSNTRHRDLYTRKWADEDGGDDGPAAQVSAAVVTAARAGRCRPRDTSLADLRSVAGIAAADLVLGTVRWMGHDAPFQTLKSVAREPGARRALAADLRSALRRRTGR